MLSVTPSCYRAELGDVVLPEERMFVEIVRHKEKESSRILLRNKSIALPLRLEVENALGDLQLKVEESRTMTAIKLVESNLPKLLEKGREWLKERESKGVEEDEWSKGEVKRLECALAVHRKEHFEKPA